VASRKFHLHSGIAREFIRRK